MLNALFGVAYGLETPFFPQLPAPNLAPKTEQHRNRTVHFIGSIVKPRSNWPKKSFEPPISKFRTLNTKGRNNNSPERQVKAARNNSPGRRYRCLVRLFVLLWGDRTE